MIAKALDWLFPKTMLEIRKDAGQIGFGAGRIKGFEEGEQQAGGAAVEMGEVIKSTLSDPIRIGWAYKRALDGFGKFTPNHFYAACKFAAGMAPEDLPE